MLNSRFIVISFYLFICLFFINICVTGSGDGDYVMGKDPFQYSPLIAKKRASSLEISIPQSQSLTQSHSQSQSQHPPPPLPFSLPHTLPLSSPYSIGMAGLTSLSIPLPLPLPLSPQLSSTLSKSNSNSNLGPQNTGFSPSSKSNFLPTPVCISLQNPGIFGTSSPPYSNKKYIQKENFLTKNLNHGFQDKKENEKISESTPSRNCRKTFCSTDSELDAISPFSPTPSQSDCSYSSSYNNIFEKLFPNLSSNTKKSENRHFHRGSELLKNSNFTESETKFEESWSKEDIIDNDDVNVRHKKMYEKMYSDNDDKTKNENKNENENENKNENENENEEKTVNDNDNDVKERNVRKGESEETTVGIRNENCIDGDMNYTEKTEKTENERNRCQAIDWTYGTCTKNSRLLTSYYPTFVSPLSSSSSISVTEYPSVCSTLSAPSPNLRQYRDNDSTKYEESVDNNNNNDNDNNDNNYNNNNNNNNNDNDNNNNDNNNDNDNNNNNNNDNNNDNNNSNGNDNSNSNKVSKHIHALHTHIHKYNYSITLTITHLHTHTLSHT